MCIRDRSNAVHAVTAALETNDPACVGEVFNVAVGQRTNLLELIDALRNALARIDPAVADVAVEHIAEREGDIRDSLADIRKATTMLGYRPSVDLIGGLDRAVPWYVRHWS